MSKKKTQKGMRVTALVAGIAMIVATASSLGVATYAWFTRGTEANATGFDFTASAAAGIQISADAQNWKSNITADDIVAAVGGQVGSRTSIQDMEPVSTVNKGNTTGDFDFYISEYVSDAFNIDADKDTANFLTFNLYFQNAGTKPQRLRLGETSSVLDAIDQDKDTSLSTRVGFIVQGSDVAANYTTLYGVNTVDATNGGEHIWEPNSLARSSTAIANGAMLNAKYDYHGLIAGGQTAVAQDKFGTLIPGAAYSEQVNNTFDLELGDAGIIATLPAERITKIKVFVWIEGQDIDCNNATSEGSVEIALNFDAAENDVFVGTKTATAPAANDTEVTLSAGGSLGATYMIFVKRVESVNFKVVASGQADNFLNCTLLIASGSKTEDGEPSTISLEAFGTRSLALNDIVVVKGIYSGSIEYRDDTVRVA